MSLKYYQGLVLVLLFVSIPLFAHLDELPIQLWDEGRVAVRALEMHESGNWLVTTYKGEPDMWSVKPPLLAWLQVICIKFLGASELSMRLPSALAVCFTCLLFYWFLARKTGRLWLGLIGVLVLVTCNGVVGLHASRTGDYDALLMFTTFGYCITSFVYLEEGGAAYLLLTFIFLTLAVLTKGIQGLLFVPAIVFYTVVSRNVIRAVKSIWFYVGMFFFVATVGGFYAMREHANPGYLHAVLQNELGGRFGKVIEGHDGPLWYYLDWIWSDGMKSWWWAILPGLVAGLWSVDSRARKCCVYFSLLAAAYLATISLAATKLWWYALPLFPFLALFVSEFIWAIFKIVANKENLVVFQRSYHVSFLGRYTLPVAFLFLAFFKPYYAVVSDMLWPVAKEELHPDIVNEMAQYLKMALHKETSVNLDGARALDCYPDNLVWYTEALKINHIAVTGLPTSDFGNASKVIAYRPYTKLFIESHYMASPIDSQGNVKVYEIAGIKKDH